jgi:hypothetical protein
MIKLTFQITQLPKITTNNTVEGYRPLDLLLPPTPVLDIIIGGVINNNII